MARFDTLRDNIESLESAGLLRRVERTVNKDTELMPLVRCQFLGLPEDQRTSWLFERVTDVRGHEYDMPVGVALAAPSRTIYRHNLGVDSDEALVELWNDALENPIEPVEVDSSPVQDTVLRAGDDDLDVLPVPISTPGFDPAPFHTSGFVVTKDPETGAYNMGTYRCHIKSPDTYGIYPAPGKGANIHWQKAKERGEPLEAAIAIGAPAYISLVSVSRVPGNQSEFGVSGALLGEPLELVQAETVDLLVPACAEIVIEGEISLETHPEGPFGEFTGYMGESTINPVFEISAITHRPEPVYQAFISEMPPSESSLIKKVGYEQSILGHLQGTTIAEVRDVVLHEASGSRHFCVIQLDKQQQSDPWQALYAASGYYSEGGKFCIAVDDDIDPEDPQSVIWAMSFRVQPEDDIQVVHGRQSLLDPVSAPFDAPFAERKYPGRTGDSAVLIDATMPWGYRPHSLPSREYMERGRELWDELDLPAIELAEPWYGYSLGAWSDPEAEAAANAMEGRYFETDYEDLYGADLEKLRESE
jgi:4-hydroxy-3-polyprenylbenzoate decarboxylase